MTKSQLSDLPDEVLCDILCYLSEFDAIRSFLHLNKRFDQLLRPFKNQIDLTKLKHAEMISYMHQYLPCFSSEDPLRSIKLGNRNTPGQVHLFNTLLSDKFYSLYLHKIDRVTVESARIDELIFLVEKFISKLSELDSFTLKIYSIGDEQIPVWSSFVINSILSKLSMRQLWIDLPKSLELSRLTNETQLKCLVDLRLNISIVADLLILIPHIPNMKNLRIRISWWTSGDQLLKKILDEVNADGLKKNLKLEHMEKFHLIIGSILNFNFNQFEKVLRRVINQQRIETFRFTVRNCLNFNHEISSLTHGEKWKNILSNYTSLKNFHLYIRTNDGAVNGRDIMILDSFRTSFFLKNRWFFCCSKYSNPQYFVLYSSQSKHEEPFLIKIGKDFSAASLSTFRASTITIDQMNCGRDFVDYSVFEQILRKFSTAKELRIVGLQMNFPLIITRIHSEVERLKIEREKNSNSLDLLGLLPSINTLSIEFNESFYLTRRSPTYVHSQYL